MKPFRTQLFLAALDDGGIPRPVAEYCFCSARKWRFDFAWINDRVALEVQGGIFRRGRHTQGAALLKEWEKLNTAACLGWRVLYCQPDDLLRLVTIDTIREALAWKEVEH